MGIQVPTGSETNSKLSAGQGLCWPAWPRAMLRKCGRSSTRPGRQPQGLTQPSEQQEEDVAALGTVWEGQRGCGKARWNGGCAGWGGSDWRKGSPGGKQTKLENSLESANTQVREETGSGRSLGEDGGTQ